MSILWYRFTKRLIWIAHHFNCIEIFWSVALAWSFVGHILIKEALRYFSCYLRSIKCGVPLQFLEWDTSAHNDEIVNRHTSAGYTFYIVHAVAVLGQRCSSWTTSFVMHVHLRFWSTSIVRVRVYVYIWENRCMARTYFRKIQCGRFVIKFNGCDFGHFRQVRTFLSSSPLCYCEKKGNGWFAISN